MAENCIAAAPVPHEQGRTAPVTDEVASTCSATAQQRAEEFFNILQKLAGEHRVQHERLISAFLHDVEEQFAVVASGQDAPKEDVPDQDALKSGTEEWNCWSMSEKRTLEAETGSANEARVEPLTQSMTTELSNASYWKRRSSTPSVLMEELMPTGVPSNLLPFYEICGSPRDFRGQGTKRVLYERAHSWMLWWANLQEPPRSGWIARIIKLFGFEAFCILVIVCHAGFLVWGTDYGIQNLNQREPPFVKWVDCGFQTWYMVELSLKLYVHGMYLFVNDDMKFNWFDFFLVGLGTQDVVNAFRGADENVGIKFGFMRTLRLLRVAKMLRIVKVMHFFRELRLMLVSLVCSFASFVWSALTIAFMLVIFSLVFVQALTGYLEHHGSTIDEDQLQNILRYFGSVKLGMLTLFMAASGGTDWEPVYIMIQPTGQGYSMVFIMFITFFFFAVLNVLTGIFCENAMKLASPDRETVILESRRRDMEFVSDLWEMCRDMDLDRSGTIELKEFMAFLDNPRFHRYLAALDINVKDALMFFKMLATLSVDGAVSFDDFVRGCMRLKGQASSIDLQSLIFETKLLHKQQSAKFEEVVKMLTTMSAQPSTFPGQSATGRRPQPSERAPQSCAAAVGKKIDRADFEGKHMSKTPLATEKALSL